MFRFSMRGDHSTRFEPAIHLRQFIAVRVSADVRRLFTVFDHFDIARAERSIVRSMSASLPGIRRAERSSIARFEFEIA